MVMLAAPTAGAYFPNASLMGIPSVPELRIIGGMGSPYALPDYDHARLESNEENAPLFGERIPAKRKFKSSIILLIGRRGGGKTLSVTNYLYTQQKRFDRDDYPWDVWTNYKYKFAEKYDPDLVNYLGQYPEDAHHKEVGIDELQMATPNRRSLASANVNIGSMMTQVRKRIMSTWLTTQFPQVLDTWILLQVDLFLRCELTNGGRSVYIRAYDYWGQYTGNDSRKPWPPRPELYDWDFTLLNADRAFGWYDTDEVVLPIWMRNRVEVMERKGQIGWGLDAPDTPEHGSTEAMIPHGLPTLDLLDRQQKLFEGDVLGKIRDSRAAGRSVLLDDLVGSAAKLQIIERGGYQGQMELKDYLTNAMGFEIVKEKGGRKWVIQQPTE